ncbi:hypothetical protein LCGC14_0205020 [marine sediment metagenome]|uniref:Uncharacterized protein n=1 Tax=marine sediment metagenome TaxID=412755 RepID=A0A0F9UM96_9ZZZZ|nr:hypothetical protein [Phycisphaerae bacterium]HDZ43310.1 hypothetical protein [Phycisphaerae bacterium]
MGSETSGGRMQTVISAVVLLVLAGIAAAVLAGKLTYRGDGIALGPAGDGAAAATFGHLLPESLAVMTPPEHFDPATLSDKINGKAGYYLPANFKALDCQRFQVVGDPQAWLELFVFDMGEGNNAFAVFSSQRRSNAAALDLTPHAYRSGGSLYFVHGPYYVEIIPSVQSPELLAAALELAGNFVDRTAVEQSDAGEEKDMFPRENFIPGSVELQMTDVFSFEKLDHVWLARYRFDDVEVTAYLSQRASEAEASELARAYAAFLLKHGAARERRMAQGFFTELSLFGHEYIIFSHERWLAGVHECSDPAVAATLAQMLFEAVQADE